MWKRHAYVRCSVLVLAVRETGLDGGADDIESAAVVSQACERAGSGALSVVSPRT